MASANSSSISRAVDEDMLNNEGMVADGSVNPEQQNGTRNANRQNENEIQDEKMEEVVSVLGDEAAGC